MLSGGQLQRVLFARLMLQRSQLWLLDGLSARVMPPNQPQRGQQPIATSS
jgi:ABC-type Mn2+/Zn2+ transport system ATPase subunit